MLSSDLDLLSHSHVECAQFIGPVSTNRDAPYSIAKSVLIEVQFPFYVILSMVTPISPRVTTSLFFPYLFLFSFLSPSMPFVLCQLHFYLSLLFPGSPPSASSYCGSGKRGSQSRENAHVEVCVLWWKPHSHSPLDQGKASAPSAKEVL